jgi:tricorn protease
VKPDPAKPEAAKPAKPKTPNVEIDFDGIMQRVVTVPIPARNYTGLLGGKENVFYLTEAAPPAPGAPGAPGQTLLKYDLKSRKLDRIIDGIGAVDISANGEKMLYSRGFGPGQQWFIAGAGAPPPPTTQPLKLDQMEIRVDPKAEWKHMFREVWRNQRDFFYDSGVHGLDLKEAARQYEPFLDGLASRNDLNYLFMEMLGEIDASHIFVGGGSQSQEIKNVPGGLLGCDYKIENGRYRFAKIFNGENWNPQARAPLTEPGVDVKVGDYLIAVNGRDVTAPAEVYQFFEATSGKQTTIKVSADPSGANAREYTVVPIPNERQLRYLDWIEGNRRKVELATNGQVGYIHMPDTAFGGYTNFNRYLFAQAGKPGMIVDERYNGGGALADYVIEHLKRPLMNYITFRAGKDVTLPYGVVPGPKVMIVNEYAGSGGDAMPYYFKKSQLGPLVGKRTWGGLIRADGAPQLLDGGFHSAPGAGIWAPNGEWVGENVGIGPDIEIEQDPAAVRAGKDPQLEKAIEYAMAQLKKNPPEMHKRPPYSRYKKGQKAPATIGGN